MSNDLGLDRSGNGNYWTVNNLAASDQMLDSPTNNFCTLNPLRFYTTYAPSLTEGNLQETITTPTYQVFGSQAVPNGQKSYFETYVKAVGSSRIGIALNSESGQWNDWAYVALDGTIRKNDSTQETVSTYTTGDIIAVAVDLSANTIRFYKNDIALGSLHTIENSDEWVSKYGRNSGGGSSPDLVANFGQDSSFAGNKTAQGNQDSNDIGDFYYTPPTDFLALCSANLPDPTVKPSEHFNTVLYTGNGGNKTISGYDFQPDFVWGKARDQAYNHHVHDVVRGVENRLATNHTDAEYGDGALKTFTSDGYTFDTAGSINVNGTSYVNWAWKAGGAAVSNTNGTITSSVSANVDAGFSIVSYTGTGSGGATLGHGLASAPEMVIVKNRSISRDWQVHRALNKRLVLNDTVVEYTDSLSISNFGASTITWAGGNSINNSTDDFIAYCFHSVDGYSKVGSYTSGGANSDAFVYLGFRPAYVMIKPYTIGNVYASWSIIDSTRQEINPTDYTKYLFANRNYAEGNRGNGDAAGSWLEVDFTSNGFKIRGGGSYETNSAGDSYIFLAFAEMPFKWTNAR